MRADVTEKVEFPQGVSGSLENSTLTVKGPKGELSRKFPSIVSLEGNTVIVQMKNTTRNGKRTVMTTLSHINNMIKGVIEGYNYSLQICTVHFPMNVSIDKNEVVIKNFLGEAKERRSKILPGVEAKLEGDFIRIFSIDKEAAGQTAANLEAKTKVRKKDRRVFQDGIWIIEKPGEKL